MEEKRENRWLRIVSVLFVAAVLAFLAFSGIVTLVKQPVYSSYFENRSLAGIPVYSDAGVMDGSYFTALDTYLQEHTAGRNTLLRAETILNLKLLHRPVVNDVVIGKDVLVGWQDFWIYDRDWLKQQAEATADRVAAHARITAEHGGTYFYIAVPHQALAFTEAYPSYLQSHEDYYRDTADFLADALAEHGVPFLDMWKVFQSKGILQEISSRIDNHYSILGAMEVCRCLSEQIKADTGLDLQFLDEENYRIEWLPNHYMGSRTRKLFDLWHSEEHLGIVVTDDTPDFTRRDQSSWMQEPRENDSIYALPYSPDEIISYDLYMGGDWGKTVIESGRPELPSILVYGDSFTNPVECLIWQCFDTMYSFDFRHYSEHTLDELIVLYQPEIVVCIRDYEAVLKARENGQ